MIEVSENSIRQADEDAADAILAVQFDNSHTLYKLEIAAILAAHRQQAENAMQERCAKVAEDPRNGLSAWRTRERIAAAIRGIDAGGEGEI